MTEESPSYARAQRVAGGQAEGKPFRLEVLLAGKGTRRVCRECDKPWDPGHDCGEEAKDVTQGWKNHADIPRFGSDPADVDF